jgi:hypothetical protein
MRFWMALSSYPLDLLHTCSKHRWLALGKRCFGFCVSLIFVVDSSIANASRLSPGISQACSILVYIYPPSVDSLYAHAKFGKITPRCLSNTPKTL